MSSAFVATANRPNAEYARTDLEGAADLASAILFLQLVDRMCYAELSAFMTGPEREPPTGRNLLDCENRGHLPELYSGEEKGLDAVAQVKFFTPDSNWTWYASEFDGDDMFFGSVVGSEIELGYFSLSELQGAKGPWGLPIERYLYFEPQTLGELKKTHERQRGGPTSANDPPDLQTLMRWAADGGCEAACPHGCWVEPDGVCRHGHSSWLLKLGLS